MTTIENCQTMFEGFVKYIIRMMFSPSIDKGKKIMYTVVNQSTGIVVVRFLNRADAVHWMEVNNVDEKGEPMMLYKIVREGSKTP